MTTCLICETSLDYGETVPIPGDILAKVSPKRTIEEALWEFIHHSPGVCTDCNERINELSSSNDTVDAIFNSVGIKTYRPMHT